MTEDPGKTPFDMYDDVVCKMDLLHAEFQAQREAILAPVKADLNAVDEAEQEALQELSPMKSRIEEVLRSNTLEKAETQQSDHWQVQYVQSAIKVTDLKGLMMFAKEHTEVLRFLGETAPYTKIVKRR